MQNSSLDDDAHDDGVEPIDPTMVLSVLHDAADAVAAVLAEHDDWGVSGRRDGQYVSDVAADEAVHGLLDPLGYGLLSEESGEGGGPVGRVHQRVPGSSVVCHELLRGGLRRTADRGCTRLVLGDAL